MFDYVLHIFLYVYMQLYYVCGYTTLVNEPSPETWLEQQFLKGLSAIYNSISALHTISAEFWFIKPPFTIKLQIQGQKFSIKVNFY